MCIRDRSTFGVRGVRLYVDGIPATMPDGQGQTSNIDIGSLDRVEVLRGPFSALYGNSSGGVILAYTEDGAAPPLVSAAVWGGSFGTWRYGAKASGAEGAVDYVLDLSRMTTDGFRDRSAARKNLGNAKLGVQLDDASRLTIVANSVDLKAQDPLGLTYAQFQDEPRSADLASQYDTRKTVRQTQGGLVYERHVDGANTLRVMLYYGQRDTTQFQAIPPAAQAAPTQAGGVIDLTRRYGGADLRWTSELEMAGRPLTLVGGFAYDTMRETRRGYQNFTGTGSSQQLGVQGALRRDETNTVYNADPYVQASWRVAPQWTLDAGLRYSTVDFDSRDHYIVPGNGDDSGSARYRRALPVAAIGYEPAAGTRLYASYGRGFETPTLNEISYRPGGLPGLNFGLAPALSTHVEAGVKTRVGDGLLTAAVFQVSTDDEIVSAGSSGGRTTFRNAGRTRRDGPGTGLVDALCQPMARAAGLHVAGCAVSRRRRRRHSRRQPHPGHRAAIGLCVAGLGAAAGLAGRHRRALPQPPVRGRRQRRGGPRLRRGRALGRVHQTDRRLGIERLCAGRQPVRSPLRGLGHRQRKQRPLLRTGAGTQRGDGVGRDVSLLMPCTTRPYLVLIRLSDVRWGFSA